MTLVIGLCSHLYSHIKLQISQSSISFLAEDDLED